MLCYVKIICFCNGICSIHQPISSTWIYKLSIGIAWTYFIAIETNLFKLFFVPTAWTSSGCTGSGTHQKCIRWKRRRCCCSFCARLISVIALLQFIDYRVSQKPNEYSLYDFASRRLFFYHRLAHEPAYTRNSDDW